MRLERQLAGPGALALALALATVAGCGGIWGGQNSNALSGDGAACPPEPVTLDANHVPRNSAGQIRWCFPGETNCHCNSDNDCYPLQGYIPCDQVTAQNATSCPPESTYLDANGEPRNSHGDIRYCWPGENLCHCDSWNDCYAQSGYVPCSARPDAGSDARTDTGPDARDATTSDTVTDVARDGGACPPEPVTLDANHVPHNSAGQIRWCFPGEAYCHCNSDNDCYDLQGYIPCDQVTAQNATSCPPESTYLDANGEPRNSHGDIRYCWPGEALCHCDSWNDCYAQTGYVPCSARTDGGVMDARTDVVADAKVDSGPDVRDAGIDAGALDARDGGACPPEPVTLDANHVPHNSAGQIRWCFPGEAYCHCNSDNDCYDLQGYIPCDQVTAQNATSCPPESTYLDANGEPRNSHGDIRYCWPGEALCHCDSWNDCYAQTGYVPCSARIDAGGTDARTDVPTDTGSTDAGSGAASMGQWSAIVSWPSPAVHASLLPNGKILSWSELAEGGPTLWDPATGTHTAIGFTRTDLHCVGQGFLPDGTLLLAGGEAPGTTDVGVKDVNLYSYATNTFSDGPDMANARWYPTNTALPNGEMVVVAGNLASGPPNPIPEVWTAAGTWRELSTASLLLDPYPFMFLLSDGRVFQAGPNTVTHLLNTAGTGSWTTVGASLFGERSHGTGVIYDTNKVLIVGGATISGGHGTPTATAEVIDLNAATPAWRYTHPMSYARQNLNATLLPDGTVLVTGGTGADQDAVSGAVYAAELWDPATETWTTLASMAVPRLYHSTALLMPDGRVFSGGGTSDTNHLDAEFFSPPYLFHGARPTVTSAPATVSYGQSFLVGTPDGASITRATFVRLSSVTHAFNQSQRINRLTVSPTTGGVTITAPTDRNLCPPGHYLLFLLNTNGVPSIARVVQIN